MPGGTSADTAIVIVPTPFEVYPGEDIQAKVDAEPPGSRFVIKAGTHRGQSVVPKDSDVFVGESGAVLTGEDTAQFAFKWVAGRIPRAVVIQSLIIEHYNPPVQRGAILAGWDEGGPTTEGWSVENCEIRYNSTGGIRIGDHMKVLNSNIHHNGQLGIGGIGDSVLIDGNEIAYNNYSATYDVTWEAGGAKFVLTNWLVARGNYVHDNTGPGLWSDIDSRNTIYERNRIEHNSADGVHYEISYGAIIRDNTIVENGPGSSVWVENAGIYVQNSSNVEIYGNTVTGNTNSITASYQARGSGPYGPRITRNVQVHDNVITMLKGSAGFVQDIGDSTLFSLSTIRFSNNTYSLGSASKPFRWQDTFVNALQWQGVGQDTASTFH
jgi:parallel beta-helix repeat protein